MSQGSGHLPDPSSTVSGESVTPKPPGEGGKVACLWKTCGRPVDRLLTFRQRTFFSSRFRHKRRTCPLCVRLRHSFRLNAPAHALECSLTHGTGEVTSPDVGSRLLGRRPTLERDPRENTATTDQGFDSRDLTTARRRSNVNVHRFEEIINGRSYRIEVSSVAAGQWRAQIARAPGGSAALMPFYGKTPDEAAKHLSRWLSIVHGQSRGPGRPSSQGPQSPGLKVDS